VWTELPWPSADDQETVALRFPGVAVTDPGAPGGPATSTRVGTLAGPVPMALVAVTTTS
jgi:hypothetical protein